MHSDNINYNHICHGMCPASDLIWRFNKEFLKQYQGNYG